MKGVCHVELEYGTVLEAEVHWYEGHGIRKKEIEIKKYLRGDGYEKTFYDMRG